MARLLGRTRVGRARVGRTRVGGITVGRITVGSPPHNGVQPVAASMCSLRLTPIQVVQATRSHKNTGSKCIQAAQPPKGAIQAARVWWQTASRK